MSSTEFTKSLSAPRREMLAYIKSHGSATIGQLAERLGISDEAVRQHVLYLENQGWIAGQAQRSEPARAGRPVVHYSLTESGDHLFPKRYDQLSVVLIDTLVGSYGIAALEQALSAITDSQVREWEIRLAGKSLEKRIEMLRGFYFEDDPFASVEKLNGELVLVERNCPFQKVAMERPQLCSTTVSTLTRLLGVRVERRQRFQNGDGRCTFHILKDQPVDTSTFRFEFERQSDGPSPPD
jgi:predicted ArsR family transcriptional regulator